MMQNFAKTMYSFLVALLFVALFTTPILLILSALKGIDIKVRGLDSEVNGLIPSCVMIEAVGGVGSGVAFRNGDSVFVWTAAHVIEGGKTKVDAVDKNGQPVAFYTFPDVLLSQELFAGGRKSGYEAVFAKVIRYSERHDLALLRVRMKWPKGHVRFSEELPAVGSSVWHVGSISGNRGCNSAVEGVVSAVGRLRLNGSPEELRGPEIYDQVALAAHPGSSGGGVFLKSDRSCIGLVIEFLGPGQLAGALCIAPVRRMREFCREAKCEWAMRVDVPVPEVDDEPVSQDVVLSPRVTP